MGSLVAVYRGVMLYGDSGNGKSSLINAGLLPDVIAAGFHAERVRVQPRAGEELVVERIATADEDDGEYLASLLATGDDVASRVVLSTEEFERRLRDACTAHRPLIIFDQFEEILTLFEEPGAEELQRRVVELLVKLLRAPLPVKLLFAFREDYLGAVKQLLSACPELVDQALRLGPPAGDALPTIIRGPFERFPGHFDRELDERLATRLRDALADRFGTGDVSLSEVQTVCLRLWHADDPQALLTARGPQGLLEDSLGEALDAFPADLRAAAVALLAQMVTSSGTRNVISADDLMHRVREEEDVPPRLLEQALQRLESDSKLVRRERRRDIYFYEITSEFLVPWISERRDEARRLHDRRRERRRAAISLVVVACFAAIAVWAIAQRNTAERQANVARSLGLVGASGAQLSSHPDVALLLAMDAYRSRPRRESRSSVIAARIAAGGSGVSGILHGHDGTVFAVAFGPGHTLASAGADRTIRLWDARTHRQLGAPLTGHQATVYGVAFSPDGRKLASASYDRTIRLWDVRTHRQLGAPLRGHQGTVYVATFSPDGQTLASASDDGTVRLWDVRTHRQLGRPLPVGTEGAYTVAFSPDRHTLATGGADRKIRLWDLRTHRQLGPPLTGHKDRIVSVAFSPDARTLASASFDGTVRRWRVRSHKDLGPLLARDRQGAPASSGDGQIYSVAFSRDGRTLASAGADHKVRLWSAGTGRQLATLTGHDGVIFGVAFSRDGHTLASGSSDTTIRLVDVRTQAGPLTDHTSAVTSFAFSPDGQTLASAGSDTTIRLSDTRTQRPLGQRLTGHTKPIRTVAFSPDGHTLASAGDDMTIRLWDVRTHRPLGAPLTGHTKPIRSVAFSPDGRTLASAGEDTTIRLWDVRSHRHIGTLDGHGGTVYSVAFGRDGTLASGHADHATRLWDIHKSEPLAKLSGHGDFVFSVAFSPDGRTLASGSFDATIRLWDVRERRQVGAALTGHTDRVTSVAFSPDGRTLASASADHTIRLWDVTNHQQVGMLSGVGVPRVAFSRSGVLAFGGRDNTVQLQQGLVWRDFAALRQEVCGLVGTGLTRREWNRYAADIPYRQGCP